MLIVRRLAALVFALVLFGAAPAAAEEAIQTFATTIFIEKDGTLDVTERIRVNAENVRINRGIFRDFPTRYTLPNGGRMKVGFKFVEARLDGGTVESSIESLSNGVRIRLGSPDVIIAPGVHDYLINYRVTRQLGFFDGYDELYWNVTGNGWEFPILQSGIQINLPQPVRFGQRAFYTGPQGSTEGAALVSEEKPGSITILATRRLESREGLTVAVAFPKGVVNPPSESQKLGWWLADMLPMAVAGLGLAAIAGFMLFAWRRAGRDPPEGTIVPLFAPPDDLSPAAMRYVVEHELDDRAFAAALVEAGVKGHVVLGEDEGVLFFGGKKYIQGATGHRFPLGEPEQSAIAALVAPGERLDFDNEHHATFSAAKSKLEKVFKARFEDKAFKRNHAWAGLVLGIWAIAAYLTAMSLLFADGQWYNGVVFVPLAMAAIAFFAWRLSKTSGAAASCLFKGAGVIAGVIGLGSGVATLGLAIGTMRWQPLALIALGLPLALSTFFWISAPTKEGRAILDRIAGFKQYLSITERERLDRMQAPRDTLQMFERWLPYAVALGVENRWADRFSSQLAAAAAAGQQGFAWYHGSHSPWTDTNGFVSSIGSSLSSSVSSASTAPGSSSGSGGGGSSGGGGGGGGGGGW
jgi:uncharacterized membrane protein YgcG